MKSLTKLILGDLLAIALLTLIGFAAHGEFSAALIPRMCTTFFPVLFSWFLLAPWFGLLDQEVTTDLKLLWRVPLAMLFAAPLAAVVRASLLGGAAPPIFTLVLGASFALGLLLWRTAYGFLMKRGSI